MFPVTLAPLSIKELLHKGWGSPRPPHKDHRRRSTPSQRVEDVPASHQDSKENGAPRYKLGQLSSTAHKAQYLVLTLNLELA